MTATDSTADNSEGEDYTRHLFSRPLASSPAAHSFDRRDRFARLLARRRYCPRLRPSTHLTLTMDPSAFGPAPANVDTRDWKELTSAFSSISSPDFAVKPADFVDPKDLGNGQPHNTTTHSTCPHIPLHIQRTSLTTCLSTPPRVPSTSLLTDPKLEREWATTAGRHAETYMKLLQSIKDKTKLKLTQYDNDIYHHFRTKFPNLDITNLTENSLKNDSAKKKWREFCNEYQHNNKVHDFNFACLLRLSCNGDYEESDNVTIVPKIQFLAIEIARNRENRNDKVKGQKYT